MLLIALLLLQDLNEFDIEPINALLFFSNGDQSEMVNCQIRGPEPYHFEFRTEEGSTLVSLLRVASIRRVKDSNRYEVLFITGERQEGRIKSLSLGGGRVLGSNPEQKSVYLHHLEKVHFVGGQQLRSCPKGHYEERTLHPFCPVCGQELELGPFAEIPDEKPQARPRTHRLRLDPRGSAPPTSGRIRN